MAIGGEQVNDANVAARARLLAGAAGITRLSRIMDIGANPIHPPPYAALRQAGLCTVYGFEPHPAAFAKLQQEAGRDEVYYPYAVGSGRMATYHQCHNGPFSSLFTPSRTQLAFLGQWEKALEVVDAIEIQTHALDSIEGVDAPDLLKLDVQGAELEIISSGSATLKDAVCIIPEIRYFRIYENEPMMGELDQHLRAMGFMLHKLLPGAHVRIMSSQINRLRPVRTQSQMIDADAIYIRDLARPDGFSDAQLGHLAIFADSVFDSKDLVLRCLDLLVARGRASETMIDQYIGLLPQSYLRPIGSTEKTG